jgi:2-iminoacetate synthase
VTPFDKREEIAEAAATASMGGPVDPDILRGFLSSSDPSTMEKLRAAAVDATRAVFGMRVLLFAPLYFSNVCVNNCLYCGFRRDNRAQERIVLTPEKVTEEARALLHMGHRRVLVIASEDPSPRGRAREVEAVRRVREASLDGARFRHVSGELAAADEAHYRDLARAGVDSYVLFQETYDRAIYARVHPEGPKSDYDHRLGAPARALAAGIPHVGLGVLLGLGDPCEETLSLIRHARRIAREFGHAPRTVSLPRMEPAEGSDLSRHPYRVVSDDELLKMIAVIRIALPKTGIVLSSRETAAFRDRALGWGVTEISAGSRTDPGGYTAPPGACALAQFELQDRRGVDTVSTALRAYGLEPDMAG